MRQEPLDRTGIFFIFPIEHVFSNPNFCSQAVRAGNTIYLSGSLGLDPKTGDLKEGVVEQTHQSLKNIGEVLKAAGADYGHGGLSAYQLIES